MTTAEIIKVTPEAIKAMDKAERGNLKNELNIALFGAEFGDEWSAVYNVYESLNYIEDEEYREENMEAFKAYEARMHEPDFDWSYYSDWHKDMFGYRPHYDVIPATEEERVALFNKFHAERGV